MSIYPAGVGTSGYTPAIDGAGEYERHAHCEDCGWHGWLDTVVDEVEGGYVGSCPGCREQIIVDFDAPQPRRIRRPSRS